MFSILTEFRICLQSS